MFADSRKTERLKILKLKSRKYRRDLGLNDTMIQALVPALPSLTCPLEIICLILCLPPVLNSELILVSRRV